MINCLNLSCQTPNPEGTTVCPACGTPIPHYFLWAVGLSKAEPGTRLFSRYEVKRDQVVLDTQPGLIPESPAEFPGKVLPYLALSAHSLHIPRPYALLQGEGSEILLLENGAIAPTERDSMPSLLPALADQWQQVGPLRQLNWLWQIAQLWQPLETEKVVGSLLSLPLLRVEGSIVRLMELRLDTQGAPDISALGTAWQTLAETAHEAVCEYLVALCDRLRNQEFATAERLVSALDTAIATLGKSQGIHYEMAVQTDQGPVRQRNEDACYPDSGTAQVYPMPPNVTPSPLLVIVCDGIGGHQGGDVASRLAIRAIQDHLKPRLAQPDLDPVAVTLAIEEAICVANDQISQQNDREARQARDRMGTTLVMALALGPQLYIGHVGDSRAYRIGPRSCRQITLDDDVAAREVRLGYGFYREVVDHPGAGALVQALGMNASQSLYPNVQRLILDEDCLFVLCSDGLSDNDRVEQFWQTELLPVLQDRASPATSTAALIQLANTYNGHDNVTISLLRSRITQPATHKVPVIAADPSQLQPVITQPKAIKTQLPAAAAPAPTVLAPTRKRPLKPQKSSPWPLLLGILGLLGIGAGLSVFFFTDLWRRPPFEPPLEAATPATPEPEVVVPPPAPEPQPAALEPGSYARVRDIQASAELPLPLYVSPRLVDSDNPALSETIVGRLRGGSLIQVLGKQEATDQARWVHLKLCQASTVAPSASGNVTGAASQGELSPGEVGWVLEAELSALVQTEDNPPPSALAGCQN